MASPNTYSGMPSVLEEELLNFENAAAHFALGADEWGLSELDEEALRASSSNNNNSNKSSVKLTSRVSTMKIDSSDSNNDTDIFGCGGGVRFGSNTFNKGRPSMISAKYRLKEERRKVLKISISKLKRIEDPESSLRRSVLINNTMKRLQREAREEKLQRQGIYQTPSVFEPEVKPLVAPIVERMEVTTTPCSRKRVASREEAGDECDVQDVLSHFYMPPTPRLLTSIDEEDEEPSAKRQRTEIKEEPAPDPRPSTPEPPPPPPPSDPIPTPVPCCDTQVTSCDVIPAPTTVQSSSEDEDEDIDVVSETNTSPFESHFTSRSSQDLTVNVEENNPSLRLRDFCDDSRFTSSTDRQTNNNIESSEQQHFSCGHSSIFGELQSVVFHSLIASLES